MAGRLDSRLDAIYFWRKTKVSSHKFGVSCLSPLYQEVINMSHVRWDPWKRIGYLQNRINQMIADPAFDPRIVEDEIAECEWKPAVDILDTADGVIIKADLPGVKKEDVSVELKDNLMTLKGERKADLSVGSEKCFRRERCFGTFFRAFTLPERISADHIRAVLKDGVLEIYFPKPEKEKPRQIHVHVN